ncbi:hypothetical protein PGT21_034808 [Puccinia graminis f. sp. tritici]|uniref:Uncharacterized protein n=1 Tax=Puccinia graminis f. sp. tritici TaxID=56615 RepID=A0A5B0R2Y7_PUCGR|nr:hypothetical protein PGT21_034808 [Puccinia graminis f. sp. tritici]
MKTELRLSQAKPTVKARIKRSTHSHRAGPQALGPTSACPSIAGSAGVFPTVRQSSYVVSGGRSEAGVVATSSPGPKNICVEPSEPLVMATSQAWFARGARNNVSCQPFGDGLLTIQKNATHSPDVKQLPPQKRCPLRRATTFLRRSNIASIERRAAPVVYITSNNVWMSMWPQLTEGNHNSWLLWSDLYEDRILPLYPEWLQAANPILVFQERCCRSAEPACPINQSASLLLCFKASYGQAGKYPDHAEWRSFPSAWMVSMATGRAMQQAQVPAVPGRRKTIIAVIAHGVGGPPPSKAGRHDGAPALWLDRSHSQVGESQKAGRCRARTQHYLTPLKPKGAHTKLG